MIEARAALWLGLPPGSLARVREYRAAHLLADEARMEFVLAVAAGVQMALARPQERRQMARALASPLGERPRRRPVTAMALRAAGIGVRVARREEER